MQHLVYHQEPRRGDEFNLGNHLWIVRGVTHLGGTNKYRLNCRSKFTQGDYFREFSAEVRA